MVDIFNGIIAWGLDYLHTNLLALVIVFIISFSFLKTVVGVQFNLAIFLAYIPVLVIDWTYSYGTYTFQFLNFFTYNINNLVLTFRGFDWIFNYGLFKMVGLDTFNSVTGTYTLTNLEKLLVFLQTFGDSIIEFAVIFYIAYYLTDKTDVAAIIAAIPTLLYSYYVSNPFKEFTKEQKFVEHALYFINHASQEQLSIVLGSLIFSFALIVLILSVFLELFEGLGASTIRPGLEAHKYAVSHVGTAFGLALTLSIVELLHPEFFWYNILLVSVIYGMFISTFKGHADNRRAKKQQKQMIREALRNE